MFESASGSSAAAAASFQRTARWLLAAVIVLILYGSLFPFEFEPPAARSLYELAASLTFQHSSRGDVIANLLLYTPLGLCMTIALPRRWRAAAVVVLTIAAGMLLSLTVELLQTLEPARVASLTDVLLNTAGTASGCAAALVYVALGTHIQIPGLADSRPAPIPLGFVLLWLSYRLAPFVPTLDWQKIKDALKPVFLSPTVDAVEALAFLVGWLVVAHAVRRMWRREYATLALVALAAGTQIARVFIVGKTLNPSELAALVALLALVPAMGRLAAGRRSLVLALAIAAIIFVQGMEPWQFAAGAHAFSWVPFKSSLSDSLDVNIGVLLEKFFWYASLVWLLTQWSRALVASAAVATLLVGAIEFVQVWLPGRSAEITDPLLVLAVAGLLGLLETREQRSAAS
jgi:VanZ family protein